MAGHKLSHGIAFDLAAFMSKIQDDVIKAIRHKLDNNLINYPIQRAASTFSRPKGDGKGTKGTKGDGKGGKGRPGFSSSFPTGQLRAGAWEFCKGHNLCGFYGDKGFCGWLKQGTCSFEHVAAAEIHRRMDLEKPDTKKEKKSKRSRSRSRSRNRRDRRR